MSFDSAEDNLFEVFGTHKLLRVLSPSLRNVPFTGIEWSFLLNDLGFDQKGRKLQSIDVEMMSKFNVDDESTAESVDITAFK
jgi:hypothetical protein